MPSISVEDYQYFENRIYLPMLIKVLEHDLQTIMKQPFKLHRPYIAMVENALKNVISDLKKTDIYLKRNNMKLVRENMTKEQSDYVFIHMGWEERKTYLNTQLRDRTEELLSTYLIK